MIVKISIFLFICLLFVLFFYPLRFLLDFSYVDGKGRVILKICPFFTLRPVAFTVFDNGAEKKEKKEKIEKKQKSKSKKSKKKESERVPVPLHEMFFSVIKLIGRFKKGLNRLRIRLNVAYGFPDPALTGELTGAFYAVLPPFCGDRKHCNWRFGLYPQWCPQSPVAEVKGDICFNLFELLIAFIGMIPEFMKILPKKKKHTEVHDESTSH